MSNIKTICNNFCSFAFTYYDSMLMAIDVRQKHLQSLLDSGKYDSIRKEAGRYAGRKPGWHIETGLLDRVRKAGFGSLVKQFKPLSQEDFDQSLERSERLMSEKVQFTGNKRKLIAAAARVKVACKFPQQKFKIATPQQAADEQINKQSSSGYPYFQRKGKVIDLLVQQAELVFKGGLNEIWDWPMVRGFRIQIRESLNELSRKVRTMYPYPGVIILLEDCFIMPFVAHFMSIQTFYVIGLSGWDIGQLIRRKFKSKIGILRGTDISAFDQSVQNEVTILAFAILRSQLSLTKEQSVVFDSIVKYFCTSIMVSRSKGSEAYAFVKTHGVPSGSGFTNMIDSIVQAICVEYAFSGALEDSLICGDDNLFFAGKMDYAKYCKVFGEVFNLTIDPIKSMVFDKWDDVYFLGFRWKQGIRMVSPRLCINQVLWHTDFITDLDKYERELARGASVLLNGMNGRSLFEKIFPDVIHDLDLGIDVRFKYLYGTAPPSTFAGVSGKLGEPEVDVLGHEPSINESLRLHLERGWAIR